MSQLQREQLFDGIFFNTIADNRFKTNLLSINIVTPMEEKTASVNALVPKVLKKGYSEHPDFTEFSKYLNSLYGTSIGSGVDKSGDNQIIKFNINYIDDKYALEGEDLTKSAVDILFGVLLEPVMENNLLLESEVAIEKELLKDRILSQINEKRSYALSEASKLMFKGEPAGISKLGTIEDVDAITAKSLTEAYLDLITKSSIEIMFVGCGDSQKAKELAKEKLQNLKRDYVPHEISKLHTPLMETVEHIEKMEVSQCKLVMGFSLDEVKPEDSAKFQMMVAVLGGTPTSKLFLNVREKLSLCYYCAARANRIKGVMNIDAGVELQNVEKAKAEILNQISLMQNGEVTSEELEQEKMGLINAFKTVNDSNFSICEYYLGGIIQNTIASTEQRIEEIQKVTIEDVCQYAKKLKLDVIYLLQGNEKDGE